MNIVIVGCGNVGFETAKLLAQDNSILLIDCCQPEYLIEFLEKQKNVYFALGDATDLTSLRNSLSLFGGKYFKIDALISTVGTNCPSLLNENIAGFRGDFEQNFFGNLVPLKVALEQMIPARAGKIVVLSSTSGVFTYKTLSAYPPVKWAIASLCRSLRSELKPYGISVDVLFPRNIKNKYSRNFLINSGLDPKQVALKIAEILKCKESKSSNHFIPPKYFLLHPLERLFPGILDRQSGLKSKRKRKKQYKATQINTVVITGASSGLGRELAKLYSRTAKTIYLVARNYELLSQIKNDIMQISECKVHIASVDIANPQAVTDFVDSIDHADLLINNAGSSVTGRVVDISIEAYKQNLATNFFGAVQLTAGFLNKKSRPIKIINILSTTAIAGRREHSCYSASKTALWAFTRSLRRTIGNEIQVIEVLPSTFQSDFAKNAVKIETQDDPAIEKTASSSQKILTVQKLTSQKVAEAIYKAERKGKEIVLIPFKSRLFLILEACAPRLFRKIFG